MSGPDDKTVGDVVRSGLSEARRIGGAVKRSLRPAARYATASFAQEGEDLVLKRALEGRATGFYVDVGAHHPMRFSNTFVFYEAGWRGINIDATPGSMEPFRRERPRDINVEVGIADRAGTLKYFTFEEPALCTFSEELARIRQFEHGCKLKEIIEVRTERLGDVLARHLPPGTAIDFLTVDVEGWDLVVLQSNDWQRFRPHIVVAEALDSTLETISDTPLVRFLREQGYQLFAKTLNSVFLRRT
jgi:FkbM family methyltransferase